MEPIWHHIKLNKDMVVLMETYVPVASIHAWYLPCVSRKILMMLPILDVLSSLSTHALAERVMANTTYNTQQSVS